VSSGAVRAFPTAPHSALVGIAMVIGACACFAVLDTTTKYVSASVPLLMALWFRYAFQAVATTLAVLPMRGAAVLRTRHLLFQCLRGVLLLSSSLFAFASLKYMPFTAIVMISPLAITVLAATVLKEKVSALRWLLVAGGFAGTLVIIRPGGAAFNWASLLPLGLVATNAWFQVLTSKLARTEDPVTMHLYTGWVGTLIASLALPFVAVAAAVPDGRGGDRRPFRADPRLPARAGGDTHALPLRADRLRHAGRLDRVPARSGPLVDGRDGDDRGLRRRRCVAYGARAPAGAGTCNRLTPQRTWPSISKSIPTIRSPGC
jgi:hypothetical protein